MKMSSILASENSQYLFQTPFLAVSYIPRIMKLIPTWL